MYSKREASQLRQEFWTILGQYMNPILSAEGEKINWTNYKTGEKNIAFRMNADNKKAEIAIELSHSDKEIQQIYFEQFLQFKNLLHQALPGDWIWQLHAYNEQGKTVSTISQQIFGLSIFKKEDWPQLISFFKPRIVALDEFWSSVKYTFEMLR